MQFACPICSSSFHCRDELAGRKARCQTCGQKIRIPISSLPAPTDKTMLGVEIPSQQFDVEPIKEPAEVETQYAQPTRPVPAATLSFDFNDPVSSSQPAKLVTPQNRAMNRAVILMGALLLGGFAVFAIAVLVRFDEYRTGLEANKKVAAAKLKQAENEKAIIVKERKSIKLEDDNLAKEEGQPTRGPVRIEVQRGVEPNTEPSAKKGWECSIPERLEKGRAACKAGKLKEAKEEFAIGVLQCIDGGPQNLKIQAEFCFRLFYLTKDQQWQFDFHDNMRKAGAKLLEMKEAKLRIAKDHFDLVGRPTPLATPLSRLQDNDRQAMQLLRDGQFDSGYKKLLEARDLPFNLAQSSPQEALMMGTVYARIISLVGKKMPSATLSNYTASAMACSARGGIEPRHFNQWFAIIGAETVKAANEGKEK